jgi:hypothetical protein
MDIRLVNGIETLTISTDILWFLDSKQNFDDMLTDALLNLKKQGFKVVESFENFDGWEYIHANLPQGERILA